MMRYKQLLFGETVLPNNGEGGHDYAPSRQGTV